MILRDPNAGSKITISKPGGETPEQILDLLKRNFFWTFLPPIVRMICGRRKYSSKYGMVESICNMSLVSQGKGLTFVAPGQELTHHFFFHFSASQTWLESWTEDAFNPSTSSSAPCPGLVCCCDRVASLPRVCPYVGL